MAILEIEIDTDLPDQDFFITLDRLVFLFRVQFNFRARTWSLSVSLEDGTMLVAGVPLITGLPFMNRYKDVRLPPGTLFVRDLSGNNLDPGEASWGDTHQLYYSEAT